MTTIDPTKPISSEGEEQLKSNSIKSTRGFASHPENINRTGLNRKEWTFRGICLDALEEEIEVKDKYGETTGKVKRKVAVIKKLFQLALSGDGDLQAIKEIIDRVDGKAIQKQEIEAHGDWIVNLLRSNA